MNNVFKNLAQKAQTTFEQAVEYVKDKITTIMGTNSVTVQQLANHIRFHPDVKKVNKELLGLTYSIYQLEKEGIHYYLEMKGEHILQIDVHTANHRIVSYRSYRDSAFNPIKFPNSITLE